MNPKQNEVFRHFQNSLSSGDVFCCHDASSSVFKLMRRNREFGELKEQFLGTRRMSRCIQGQAASRNCFRFSKEGVELWSGGNSAQSAINAQRGGRNVPLR